MGSLAAVSLRVCVRMFGVEAGSPGVICAGLVVVLEHSRGVAAVCISRVFGAGLFGTVGCGLSIGVRRSAPFCSAAIDVWVGVTC